MLDRSSWSAAREEYEGWYNDRENDEGFLYIESVDSRDLCRRRDGNVFHRRGRRHDGWTGCSVNNELYTGTWCIISEDVYSVTDSRLIQKGRFMRGSREEDVVVC